MAHALAFCGELQLAECWPHAEAPEIAHWPRSAGAARGRIAASPFRPLVTSTPFIDVGELARPWLAYARKSGSTPAVPANSVRRSPALSGWKSDAISSAIWKSRGSPGGMAAVMSSESVNRSA